MDAMDNGVTIDVEEEEVAVIACQVTLPSCLDDSQIDKQETFDVVLLWSTMEA